MPRYITHQEATRALPDVERSIRRLRRIREEAAALRESQGELWRGLEREETSLEDIAALQRRLDTLEKEFRELLGELDGRGAILRDLDMGLVDFLSLSGQTAICLCWKVGEPSIAYWHGVNEGYAGRKPLSVLPGGRRH